MSPIFDVKSNGYRVQEQKNIGYVDPMAQIRLSELKCKGTASEIKKWMDRGGGIVSWLGFLVKIQFSNPQFFMRWFLNGSVALGDRYIGTRIFFIL